MDERTSLMRSREGSSEHTGLGYQSGNPDTADDSQALLEMSGEAGAIGATEIRPNCLNILPGP